MIKIIITKIYNIQVLGKFAVKDGPARGQRRRTRRTAQREGARDAERRTQTHTRARARTFARTPTNTNTHMHARAPTYTHTHTHRPVQCACENRGDTSDSTGFPLSTAGAVAAAASPQSPVRRDARRRAFPSPAVT